MKRGICRECLRVAAQDCGEAIVADMLILVLAAVCIRCMRRCAMLFESQLLQPGDVGRVVMVEGKVLLVVFSIEVNKQHHIGPLEERIEKRRLPAP